MTSISQPSGVTILYRLINRRHLPLPLFSSRVSAGFPSPADDYIDQKLDLNEHLIQHEAATFFVRVAGDSMKGAGINPGDILIVDRAEEARNGSVIIAILDGELTVKRLRYHNGRPLLMPENDQYRAIEVGDAQDFEVWGVVQHVIHRVD